MKQIKNILILILVAVILWLLLKNCNGKPVEIKETIKIDTVWKKIKGDTVYKPQIVNHYIAGKAPKAFEKWDTIYLEQIQAGIDTAAILEQFYSYNTYSDTLRNNYGYIIVDDTISGNMIMNRSVKTDLKIPEVTKTITKTILDKRVELYAAFGLLGNSKDLVSGGEFELLLKTKNDRMVGIGYETIFNGDRYFKIKYAHKISLRKK